MHTESPRGYNGTDGTEDVCELCDNGDHPVDTTMVINMIHIGEVLQRLWKLEPDGVILMHLYEKIQYFAFEACGCNFVLMDELQISIIPLQAPSDWF